jgi:carboxymethylenebutenolidase
MKRRAVAVLSVMLAVSSVIYAGYAVQAAAEADSASGRAAPLNHDGHVNAAIERVARKAQEGDIHAGHALYEMARPPLQAAPSNPTIPADDAGAAARLKGSQLKGEFVKIDAGGTPMSAWVVHPRGTAKKPVVIVIHEIFGLSDWIRGVADQLAVEGFIAVAPDLLSGHGPNGGDSPSFASLAEMTETTLKLPLAEIRSRLKAARDWALKLPNANEKTASVGFCFGGNQSFALAVDEPALNAAVVYYGMAPTDGPPAGGGAGAFVPSPRLAEIKAPVLGLYGGADQRINTTIPATEMKMKELGKVYQIYTFEGAGHGFLRAQSGNDGANVKATRRAWSLTVSWLKRYTA